MFHVPISLSLSPILSSICNCYIFYSTLCIYLWSQCIYLVFGLIMICVIISGYQMVFTANVQYHCIVVLHANGVCVCVCLSVRLSPLRMKRQVVFSLENIYLAQIGRISNSTWKHSLSDWPSNHFTCRFFIKLFASLSLCLSGHPPSLCLCVCANEWYLFGTYFYFA